MSALEELFTAAVRAAAIWSLGFGALLALFAHDIVHHLLGDEWSGATVLLQGLGVASALYSLGYTWIAFARGLGRFRQPAVEALVAVAVFGAIALPVYLTWGPSEYVIAICGSSAAILCVRAYFVKRMLPGVRLAALVVRCAWPVVAAAAAVLALRLALWGDERSLAQSGAELALFLFGYAGIVIGTERPLLGELRRGFARPDRPAPAAP